jgi:hypothetical protein
MQEVVRHFQLLLESLDQKAIREIDESSISHLYTAFYAIPKIDELATIRDKIQRWWISVNLKFVSSESMAKQMSGLQRFSDLLHVCHSQASVICPRLQQGRLLETVVTDEMHYGLLDALFPIFRAMCQRKVVSQEFLHRFWSITAHQHPSTIGKFVQFFKGSYQDLSFQLKQTLWNAVISERIFTKEILEFCESWKNEHIPVDVSKRVFATVSEVYMSLDSMDETLEAKFLAVIRRYVPADDENLQERALALIQDGRRSSWGIAVLQVLFESGTAQGRRREHYDMVMLMLAKNPSRTVEYLTLIANMMKKMSTNISTDDCMKVIQLTTPLLESRTEEVLKFYELLFKSTGYTVPWLEPAALYRLLKSVCEVSTVSNALIQLMIDTFKKLNRSVSKLAKGLDDVWEFYFRTGDERIVDFLLNWYLDTKESVIIAPFLEKCKPRINTLEGLRGIRKIVDL